MKNRQKPIRIAAATLYGAGVATTIILLMIVAFRLEMVPFPDAMLPMTLCELASEWLALGTVPMAIASVLLYKAFHISESSNKIRNTICAFAPTAVCASFLLFWCAVWVIGICKMAMHGRM